VRFSAALECEDVGGWVGLRMRVDGERGAQPLEFDNMKNRSIRGTTPWARYEVVLDVPVQAQAIALGVLLKGEGEARMADLALETVGPEVQTTGTEMDVLPDRPQNLDFSGGLDL